VFDGIGNHRRGGHCQATWSEQQRGSKQMKEIDGEITVAIASSQVQPQPMNTVARFSDG